MGRRAPLTPTLLPHAGEGLVSGAMSRGVGARTPGDVPAGEGLESGALSRRERPRIRGDIAAGAGFGRGSPAGRRYLYEACVNAARSAAIALGFSGGWMMPAMRPCGSSTAMVAEWSMV